MPSCYVSIYCSNKPRLQTTILLEMASCRQLISLLLGSQSFHYIDRSILLLSWYRIPHNSAAMAAEPSLSTKCLADAWAAEGGWVLALVVFVQTISSISNNHASKFQEFNETNKLIAGICWVVNVGFAIQNSKRVFFLCVFFFSGGRPILKKVPHSWSVVWNMFYFP